MTDKVDITKRILETRKQTEELKAQLQNLIDTGKNVVDSKIHAGTVNSVEGLSGGKENVKLPSDRVKIIRSFDIQHSNHTNKPGSSKDIPKVQSDDEKKVSTKVSPKKIRNYDVEEARQYIKKQREKRMDLLKAKNEEKCRMENQKKKLQELHKKSLELVSKNLQAKRDRSKSADKNVYVRPQENVNSNLKQTRSRSVSKERGPQSKTEKIFHNARGRLHTRETDLEKKSPERHKHKPVQPKNPNLLYPPSPDYVQRRKTDSIGNKTDNDRVQKQVESSGEIVVSRENNITSNNKIGVREVDTSFKHLMPINLFKSSKETDEIAKDVSTTKTNETSKTLMDKNLSGKRKSPINVISNVTLRSAFKEVKNSDLADMEYRHGQITNEDEEHVFVDQMDLSKANLEKYTRETQTLETKKEYPEWLQEQPAEAHPFNFINTVKRKLQYTINSPKPSADIGIQSSLMASRSPNSDVEQFKTREQLREIIQESTKSGKKCDMESFISHKCLNLDPKLIAHIELVPHRSSNRNYSENHRRVIEVDSRTVTKSSETESESDTSKNIPEISSESGTSLKKNAESVKKKMNSEAKLSINTDKINSMKLVPQCINSNISSLKYSTGNTAIEGTTHSNQKSKFIDDSKSKSSHVIATEDDMKVCDKIPTLSIENEYTSDFHSGSELDLSNQDLTRSRESIIAFNSPTYSKQIVLLSPEYVREDPPSKMNSNVKSNTYGDKKVISALQSSTTPNKTTHSKNIPNSASSNSNLELVSNGTHSKKVEYYNKDMLTSNHSNRDQKKTSDNSKSSRQFTSLHTLFHPSESINNQLSKSDSNLQYVNTQRGTSSFSRSRVSSLKEPDIFLTEPKNVKVSQKDDEERSRLTKNLTLRSNMSGPAVGVNNTNEIHLKFEAEIHLLNDFNESLRQFSAVEKVFETLKTKNELTSSKIFQNQDTQTSNMKKPSTVTTLSTENDGGSEKSFLSGVSTINYSRGSFVDSVIDDEFKMFDNSTLQPRSVSLISNKTGVQPLKVTKSSSFIGSNESLSNFENVHSSNFAGLSLNMFEQLIKDEDARIENLKTILKIREQVLLDRTKGELAWLEIQRKHFKETGQLQEASVIKKKQRGILVNHQKEKHEMQRLKQMQKAASIERKIVLKEQRNLIRRQLSTDSMLKKMKVSTPRDRKLSGPLKVIQNHTESIRSETSISKRSSTDREKEVFSITSHRSMVSKVSEISEIEVSSKDVQSDSGSIEQQTIMRRTLLMREEALKKRKKAAEELLQWHKKLLEEEKRIAELESTASSIISQKPATSKLLDKYKFKGKQLNQLWYNLTGCEDKKFIEDKIYPMSQMALERFCKSAREYSTKTKKLLRRNSDSESKIDSSVSESIPEENDTRTVSAKTVVDSSIHSPPKVASTNDYISDFDGESVEDIVNSEDIDVVDQSINQLINNFSKIKADISALSNNQSKNSDETEITEQISKDSKFEKSDSEAEVSVIETNRISKDSEVKSLAEEKEIEEEAGSEMISQKIGHSVDEAEESNLSGYNKTGTKNSSEENFVLVPIVFSEIDEKIESERNTVKSDVDPSVYVHESNKSSPRTEKSEVVAENSGTITQLTSEANDNLNESKEILLILGETEISSQVDLPKDVNVPNSLSATEDILSRLSQVVSEVSLEKHSGDPLQESNQINDSIQISGDISEKIPLPSAENGDVSSESLELLMKISHSDEKIQTDERKASLSSTNSNNISQDILAPDDFDEENDKSAEKMMENLCLPGESIVKDSTMNSNESLLELTTDSEQEQAPLLLVEPLEILEINFESNDNMLPSKVGDVSNNKILGIKSDEEIPSVESIDVSDQSISPIIKVVSPDAEKHISSEVDLNSIRSPMIEEIQTSPTDSKNSSGKPSLDLSYGVIETARSSEADNFEMHSDDKESAPGTSKEDINSYEEKELDSLASSTNGGSPNERSPHEESPSEKVISTEKSGSNESLDESPEFKTKDVKKRVSEIMAEANQSSKGDKSPRLQDLYITTYDLISPASSPESLSPTSNQSNFLPPASIFINEAEELMKKQLAIEQEIKAITEQQKKEQQIPLIFVREIPNKPPPPYTLPATSPNVNTITVIPTSNEIEEITKYSARILHKAYVSNNLENISISENTLSLISKDITKECYKFVFDLCKEISKEHYKQFEEEKCPTWLCSNKKKKLAVVKPLDVSGLECYMVKKLKELFVYEKQTKNENAIIKWSRKKRDHVDEILVIESQAEEAKWTNYDKDELLIINQVTNEIMNSLLKETGEVLNEIFLKRT